jgi:hypothetical protein
MFLFLSYSADRMRIPVLSGREYTYDNITGRELSIHELPTRLSAIPPMSGKSGRLHPQGSGSGQKTRPGQDARAERVYFQYFHALYSLFLPWKMRIYHTMAGGRTQAKGQFTAVPFTYSV